MSQPYEEIVRGFIEIAEREGLPQVKEEILKIYQEGKEKDKGAPLTEDEKMPN